MIRWCGIFTKKTGPSGGGKSALLANFIEQYRNKSSRKNSSPCIVHYVGCSAKSSNLGHMLRRLTYHMADTNANQQKQLLESSTVVESHPEAQHDNETLAQTINEFHLALWKRCTLQAKRKTHVLLMVRAPSHPLPIAS